jgi:hypothetical protein
MFDGMNQRTEHLTPSDESEALCCLTRLRDPIQYAVER